MNIKVHKFGGASLKDASFINNAAEIIRKQNRPLIVVVSAIDKTTNALENVAKSAFFRKDKTTEHLEKIKRQHSDIIHQLFQPFGKEKIAEIENFIKPYWQYLEKSVIHPIPYPYKQFYDQVVSVGELVSSIIVSEYMNSIGIYNTWVDIRKILITDTQWRAANVQLSVSEKNFKDILVPLINEQSVIVTQGFIGGTSNEFTTTLGREGSDYTAALMAYFANATELIIWKDVNGVLNADPRYFKNPQKIDELSYYDAIEMTYYGATVIHPKTIKPLQNKNIPLRVKSFVYPSEPGTVIHQTTQYKKITTYSYLPHQILISLQSNDYSFFAETHIQKTFQIVNDFSVKINLMQNTALNFSICIPYDETETPLFIAELQKHFKVLFNSGVAILTIRNYVPNVLQSIIQNREVLLEQRTRHHVQFVLRDS